MGVAFYLEVLLTYLLIFWGKLKLRTLDLFPSKSRLHNTPRVTYFQNSAQSYIFSNSAQTKRGVMHLYLTATCLCMPDAGQPSTHTKCSEGTDLVGVLKVENELFQVKTEDLQAQVSRAGKLQESQ